MVRGSLFDVFVLKYINLRLPFSLASATLYLQERNINETLGIP
jgi:hypothetical protein